MTVQQFLKIAKKGAKNFNMHVHSNEGDVIKMNQNLTTIVLMRYTLSKLYVDIKFDIFNMKFKNRLFYLLQVHVVYHSLAINASIATGKWNRNEEKYKVWRNSL